MKRSLRFIFLTLFILTVMAMIGIAAYALWTPPPGDIPENTVKVIGKFLILAIVTESIFLIEASRSVHIKKGDFTIDIEPKQEK